MTVIPFLRFAGQPAFDAPARASEPMRAAIAALNSHPAMVFKEREALKAVEAPLTGLKTASAEERLAFIFEALAELKSGGGSLGLQLALKGMAAALLRSAGLKLSQADAIRLIEAVSDERTSYPHKAALTAIEKQTVTTALREALLRLRSTITEWHGKREMEEIHERIDKLVNGAPEPAPVAPAAGWSRQVFEEIDRSPKQLAWRALFLHARSLTQSTASRKWQNEAVDLAERIGRAEVLAAARRWLAIGPLPGGGTAHLPQVPEGEADYQKGFVWALGALGDASIAPDIADFAFACFRKIPMVGAVSHRVGNACVNALGAMPGLDAVTQISRLAMRVKYDVARRLIEKALVEAAERNNVSRDDLEAMSVPSYGLNSEGVRVVQLGDCEARLAIDRAAGSATLTWWRAGKPLRSLPADVKTKHAEAVAELKKSAKELDAVLTTQRLRLERLLLSPESAAACRQDQWKAWYIDHPVTSVFARNLIWEIAGTGATAVWFEGKLVDWAGNTVDLPSPDAAATSTTIRLWHPLRSTVQTVLSWRCWLEDHGVRQPFKQAHREVYLLTEAERQTETYSNRFAAHIVRQHQFAALCRERGWQFNLMGEWDSHNTPCLELPRHKLRAEFDVEFPLQPEVSGHAVYLTITTGRVQFFALDAQRRDPFRPREPEALRLEEVPALVFSEVMRDADLLVGVTSIGCDPAWAVAAGREADQDYWKAFSFGSLTASAEIRRSVIESLLPKLAIGSQCRLDGHFLAVRGELNEYRIHLGSGNILMEPGSRYLCIVQGPGDTASQLPLPFDGDRMLAMILSKAMLLARDKAIKDEAIRRQFGSGGGR